MSFLVRSRNSQKWGRTGSIPGATSFSVRTGRRSSGESDSVVLGRAGPQDQGWGAAHFLRNETQAARAAVEALDKYSLKLASFQDKALEVIEEAHRALSRLERAVAKDAAPELIVVACEIKVACHRGLHLFRAYGKYRYLGKLIALATRSSITAKFDGVIGRLTAIMPLGRTPSFTSIKPAGRAAQPAMEAPSSFQRAGSGAQRSARNSLEDAEASQLHQQQAQQPPQQQQQSQQQQQPQQLTSSASGGFAAAAARLKRGSTDSAVGTTTHCHGAAESSDGPVLSVVLRSSEAAKVTCISYGDSPGTSNCIWWATGDQLEFYSTSTQTTTSFAPHVERAAVTAVAVDSVGNIWCATSKGAILMRQQRNWEQVFVEHVFSSCVRCLATDAESDVVWAGDEAGRLAVLRFVEEGSSCHLECTATILPGRAGAGVRASSSSPLLDIRPKTVSRWQALSCRGFKAREGAAEGPIRTMLVRDDRAWVGGGRTEPWIALFDAVLGTQLDMWSCGSYGSCLVMASMMTSDALMETAFANAAAAASRFRASAADCTPGGLDVPCSVPEDHIGEDPRSSWRLITGHESGQLLLWNAAADRLQPVVKVGDPGLSPVRALCVMEEQGLVAAVHANGDLALFLRPARDRDWLMSPAKSTAGAAAAAAGSTLDGSTGGASPTASVAGGSSSPRGQPGASEQQLLSPATSTGGGVGERGKSSGGGAATAAAGLNTIKPRRVVLKSHRSVLVAAAACSNGVVTASALGSIKLWPAEGLAKEAERCGLLPSALHMQAQRESSLSSRSTGSLNCPQQSWLTPMPRQNSDSLVSNACSPFDLQQGSSGLSAAAAAAGTPSCDSAGLAASAAAVAAAGPAMLAQQPSGSYQQPGILAQMAPQQGQQEHAAALLAWQQQQPQPQHSLHAQDSMVVPSPQIFGIASYGHPHQQPQPQVGPAAHTSLRRLSEPGVQWLQHQQQQPAQLFSLSGAAGGNGVLQEQLANPLVALERRSAPLDIPWQTGITPQNSAAASLGRNTGMGTAMYARLTAQQQLGQLGGSPRFNSGTMLSADGGVASAGAGSAAGSLLGDASVPGSFRAPQLGRSVDVPMDSGPRYAAPRAPKALRERELWLNRERRRSERRLSKGANIAWSTCQIIDASELRMQECIGGGAYGQVFLAEWMGTQVAAKQLLSFQEKAKDEVTKRKAKAARAAQQQDRDRDGSSDSDSDSNSDTDSVDSVEEEVAAELKQLMDEVWVLGSLSHPSITRFCALCLDPPMIVMQYYPHGSLFDLLKRGRRADRRALHELTWAKRLDMARDIASGMVFLHSRKPPIVHGDLRSPNLLLDLTIDRDRPRFHVKIADFGLARMVGPNSSIAVSKVTNPRWSAPEVMRNSVVSLSADVFSFGVVLWELLTWQQPYEEMMSVQVLFSVMQNYRPEIPAEEDLPGKPGATLSRYRALMERCWAEDEHARPSFDEVLAELDDLRQCESAHSRLRGGDSQRSLQGSACASYSEAPGTPTGSCLGGSSLAPSAPGSNMSSAPNSGREVGPIALAALAAAGAAAASAAAAVGLGGRRSIDGGSGSSRLRDELHQGRPPAASDPGTPTGAGPLACNGASAAAQPVARMQLVGGGGGLARTSRRSSSSSSGTMPLTSSGGGGFPGAGSEPSFAMRAPPLLSSVGPAAALSSSTASPTSPNVPVRTPSRLGPKCGSTLNSPTAATCGTMAAQHEAEPLQEQHSDSSRVGSGRATRRRNSAGSGAANAAAQQQVAFTHQGSRLRRLSWGTLEGSLQSMGSRQLGLHLQASRDSWGGSGHVHEFPYSPRSAQGAATVEGAVASAVAGTAAVTVDTRPYSPFLAAQQIAFSDAPTLSADTQAGAPSPADGIQQPRVSNPFASAQAQQGLQLSEGGVADQQPAPKPLLAAQPPVVVAAAANGTARSPSPFAVVQVPPLVDSSNAAAAAAPACSPFAAAQRQSTDDVSTVSAVLSGPMQTPAPTCSSPLGTSRQGTDDSNRVLQPPARPCSPFAAAQEADAEAGVPAASAAAATAAAAKPAGQESRRFSPFAAVQALPTQASMGEQLPPPAPAPTAERLPSGFPAKRPSGTAAAPQQHLLQEVNPEDLRVESLSGSPFVAAPHLLLSFNSRSGSSHSSSSGDGGSPCPAPVQSPRGPSRLGVGSTGWQAGGASGYTRRSAGSPRQSAVSPFSSPWQPQQQGDVAALAAEQQWRPPSPFAGVQAAAVQGPIVAQQAKAVLTRLNSQGAPQDGPAVHSHVDSCSSGGGGNGSAANGGTSAVLQPPAALNDRAPPRNKAQQHVQSAALMGRAFGGPQSGSRFGSPQSIGQGGSPQSSGDFAVSGESLTFSAPPGLSAVESVVFMRGLNRPAGWQPPPQQHQ